jgi:hypothetical protein
MLHPRGWVQGHPMPVSDRSHKRILETTFRHVPITEEEEETIEAVAVDQTHEAVLAAVTRLIAERERVSKSSKREVFTFDAPELEGMPRAKTREAVKALLAADRLGVDDDGYLIIPDANDGVFCSCS